MFSFAALIAALSLQQMAYPESRRMDLVETLHGTEVADPYRWLEDANADETKAWIKAQNQVTNAYLTAIPERAVLRKRFTKLFNFEKFGAPSKMGSRYFWTYNSGLQNQDVLYWSTSLQGSKRVLLDPNKLSKDGTVALSGTSISWDGRYLAYSLSKGGSDWQEWRVREVGTGKDLPDRVLWSKFSGASWNRQNTGFYYSRYEAPKANTALQSQNYFQKVYFHKLGTPQSKDALTYLRKDQKEWGFGASATEDGRYLAITVWKGTNRETAFFYQDLLSRSLVVSELINTWDAAYTFLGNEGPIFFFQTDLNAPKGRIIAVDIRRRAKENWKTIIPEAAESLESSSMAGGKLFANYLKDAHTQVKVYSLSGKYEREVKLPGLGTAGGFGGLKRDRQTYYTYASFDTPSTIYEYSISTGQSRKLWQPKVDFKPDQFITKQVFYKSKDGTRIPMFVSHKRGLKMDGTNPTLLYAYGGFNASTTPFFSPSRLMWMEAGGVSAVACIRGGGEYGKAWHDGGRLQNKQNCFDDFIAAGEWLISNNYTATPRLAIQGGSNGGLLVGACMNQRPDLFGVCLPEVGVMDMLRFHKFTIGWAWVSDYGSPDKKDEFETLLTYSPYHNVKVGTKYPATLVITGDHDDRVVPAHSFKFAAALQHAQAGDAPVLIRIETQAGHGAGKPTAKVIDEVVDKWAFLIKNMNYQLPSGFGR
ncbi:MAG TPA: prolyl oligopeptidase family serine peptidase [Fimbriimonadaceae bacterium]|nr:prolyl oligopeptidase family serine peptidase [Fimbriimonadaceae bacterium]